MLIIEGLSTTTVLVIVIILILAIATYAYFRENQPLLSYIAIVVGLVAIVVSVMIAGGKFSDDSNSGADTVESDHEQSINQEQDDLLVDDYIPSEEEPIDYVEEEVPLYPEGSLSYRGHHYYIYDDEGTSWDDAREYCLKLGGYLAVINDMDENNVLFQYMKDNGFETVHFGLIYMDGNWMYLDRDTSEFTDWGMNYKNKTQPNNYLEGDIHVALDVNMKNGTWNDVRYGRTDAYVANGHKYKNLHTYICEWSE